MSFQVKLYGMLLNLAAVIKLMYVLWTTTRMPVNPSPFSLMNNLFLELGEFSLHIPPKTIGWIKACFMLHCICLPTMAHFQLMAAVQMVS